MFVDESRELERANAAAAGALVQAIDERRAGGYLALLDAPTVPPKPDGPPRFAISLAGLFAGLSLGAFAVRTPRDAAA